jgi:DNA-binding protein H-NS
MKVARGRKKKASGAIGKQVGRARLKAISAGKLPDISGLSEEELSALLGLVELELAKRRDRKRAEFFSNVRAQAQALGVGPEEVAAELGRKAKRPSVERPQLDRRGTVAPKYRNPANPSETWAGRGAKPRWMQALLAQGKSPEDFRIDS